jgi:DNA polymerase alpha subunit B
LAAWQDRLPAPCQAVLLPSPRDAHAMPVFPQPPLAAPGHLDLVSCLQNPSLFDAGGAAVVGAASHDVLRHLAGAELQRGPHADRLAALASHLLGQRRRARARARKGAARVKALRARWLGLGGVGPACFPAPSMFPRSRAARPPTAPPRPRSFYPLFPAAPGACLDTTADAALALASLPDLLLLPSDLAPFAKPVPAGGPHPECCASGGGEGAGGAAARSVLAVNPGRLVKGSGGGTYAVLTLPRGAAAAEGGLAANCRVEIVRV